MTEFICPRTGTECSFQGLCERRSSDAKHAIDEVVESARNRVENFIQNGTPGIYRMIARDGEYVRPTEEEEIAHRRAIAPTPEQVGVRAEFDAHRMVERSLPIPKGEDEEESSTDVAYDSYDWLSGVVCLAGTAEHVRQILALPDGERELKVGSLVLWVNALGSDTDIVDL